jgi:4-hydroxy-2-oxoheptanedioate aldolase
MSSTYPPPRRLGCVGVTNEIEKVDKMGVEVGGLRSRLAAQGSLVGGWCMLGSPFAAEAMTRQALDYVTVDCEHGASGYESMLTMLSALMVGREDGPLRAVRVPTVDPGWAAWALDGGAEAVIFPCVQDAAEAAAAASACRYPPHGGRSFGPLRTSRRMGSRPDEVNENVACVVMVESVEGLEAVEEICAVPGVDGVYIGPADLSISMGLGLGALRSPMDERLLEAIERIRSACVEHGVVAGVHAFSGPMARSFLDMGFDMVTAVSDVDALGQGVKAALAAARAEPSAAR